jgi:NADH-quinone oxidoreductase subunit L
MLHLSWLIIAVPLASAAVILLAGRAAQKWGHWLAVAASATTVIVGIGAFIQMLGLDRGDRVFHETLFRWIPGGELSVDAGILVDPLSMSFVLLVSVVGTLIHVYSVAYMEHDPRRSTFFAYLNLFIAAMFLLVLADS